MKLTKQQLFQSLLKQVIKEELETVLESPFQDPSTYGDEGDHPGAEEESQDLVVAANEAIMGAKNALYDLFDAVKYEGFTFTRDSSVTLADLDYKMKQLNRYWESLLKTQ